MQDAAASYRLCWALTMRKSQAQTLDRAVLDLGKYEACADLVFVGWSRVKRIDDLLIAPMPFNKLRLGDSTMLKARSVEEVRLMESAVATLTRCATNDA